MSFSMKQAGGDPWSRVNEKYYTGQVLDGKVTRTADFGAFVELEPGLEGLVHISELSRDRVRSVADVVKPAQEIKVKVLEIDSEKRRIGLSMRRADEVIVETPATIAAAAAVAAAPKKKRPQLRGGLEF
jgi:ribosomal protein S1